MFYLLFAQEDRSAVMIFFDKWGNAASVVGFGITLIGFATTIWAVLRVKRKVVDKIGTQLLSSQVVIIVRLINGVREAGRDNQWPRAIDRCEQARLSIAPLRGSRYLLKAEQDLIIKAADDLRIVLQYIENNRLPPDASASNLPNDKRLALDRMATDLAAIVGRLQNAAMEE
jgi:hypothetical protein